MTPLFGSKSYCPSEHEDDDDEEIAFQGARCRRPPEQTQFPVVEVLLAALRKSLVTCTVDRDDVATSIEIGSPTDVRHVSHVTFDRFNGFLGLPVELQPELPRRIPSASVRVFGISPQSMQCSIDERGNSVPTILLMMQKRLYADGGLKVEGIFRITAENSQEEYVRSQLNNGLIPCGIEVHCLAGLIKAWFRELPTGVLDSLAPEQVMHCNTEAECAELVKLLPPTEAALLDWVINLLADVVHNECYNKMNARNIAMIFAPNMTQMADAFTALIHAVQVMNLLKTLIEKTIREREEAGLSSSYEHHKTDGGDETIHEMATGDCQFEERKGNSLVRAVMLDRMELRSKSRHSGSSFGQNRSRKEAVQASGVDDGCEGEGLLERLSFRKGVKKLCSHPVFQLSKPAKKSGDLGVVNT